MANEITTCSSKEQCKFKSCKTRVESTYFAVNEHSFVPNFTKVLSCELKEKS